MDIFQALAAQQLRKGFRTGLLMIGGGLDFRQADVFFQAAGLVCFRKGNRPGHLVVAEEGFQRGLGLV